MLDIICNPRLECAIRDGANGSAAVHEGLVHTARFGDMRVRADHIPIGKDEAQLVRRVLFKLSFEFGSLHELIVCV